MSTKENNSEVAVEKATENNDKAAGDAKADIKGTKRPAEVSMRVAAFSLVYKMDLAVLINVHVSLLCVFEPMQCMYHRMSVFSVRYLILCESYSSRTM